MVSHAKLIKQNLKINTNNAINPKKSNINVSLSKKFQNKLNYNKIPTLIGRHKKAKKTRKIGTQRSSFACKKYNIHFSHLEFLIGVVECYPVPRD